MCSLPDNIALKYADYTVYLMVVYIDKLCIQGMLIAQLDNNSHFFQLNLAWILWVEMLLMKLSLMTGNSHAEHFYLTGVCIIQH